MFFKIFYVVPRTEIHFSFSLAHHVPSFFCPLGSFRSYPNAETEVKVPHYGDVLASFHSHHFNTSIPPVAFGTHSLLLLFLFSIEINLSNTTGNFWIRDLFKFHLCSQLYLVACMQ